MYTLYGDGIHDDYPAIQEMIDSGACDVTLPAPKKNYLISKTLVVPSYFKLSLPRFATIKLADGANCPMIRNKWTAVEDDGKTVRTGRHKIWNFATRISPAAEHTCTNIEICGGIWDFNNNGQRANPLVTLDFGENEDYTGFGFQFFNVKNLKICSMTMKDPITFALTIDICSYFTIEDITFDFNFGNPIALNMDGVHLDGYCHHGVIRNLKGACYDDLVALNAHEGYPGPITNIDIDGIFAEDCHSAVRLLGINEKMENIHISNVYGSYYQYCIGFTKFYPEAATEAYDSITIDHVYASKASRKEWYPNHESYVFPFIWIQDGVSLKNLSLSSIHRREFDVPIELLHIGKTDGEIESICLRDVTMENHTTKPIPLILNIGHVKKLLLSDVRYDGVILENEGIIEKVAGLDEISKKQTVQETIL